ncbi:MAG: phosphoribosylformylglycinamidine synthase subunit PurL [Acidobacteria bacterium]|nr:phosphoribosylformylglycinamidine synthase subunit PurL [Acidobacteriota bacterium]
MPENSVQSPVSSVPTPAQITPALLQLHNLTPDEYALIEKALGRTPSLTELGIYSVMWSEHCSYKSSKVHLKRLPTKSELVVQGPGENAGIIDVGDGWACAFKIESHNHPSYIEPYQGAATGVGGILRDIFTMGARPLAVMDALRFGPLNEDEPDPKVRARNRQIMEGVVHGVAGYGNCFGVPNLGGETRFEPCYSGNPLLNAFALGLVRKDQIFYAKATGVGNPVIYVGAKTGRDGIHGATMASEEFKEGSEQKRPNVQMGDPFMEKLLLEACLEVMALPSKAVLGIQDMGAAGLTCSICEMGARGGVGLDVELDLVPQRETGMSSYEIMLSESQERMLLVAEKGKEQEVLDVFSKWGLDAAIVGEVIAENRMRIRHHGELIVDLSNESLTDDAPLYNRPIGQWKSPFPAEPPAHVLEELKQPRDYTADVKKLLASANICDKRYIFEQYDSMVQTNTVQGPGGEAGVMRIKGTGTPGHERGLAMALAGNGRWTAMDPKLGAMHAVAEACCKVACVGAKPVAATNNLNFGNPMKPEVMGQLSAAVDGIAEACTALGTPITGGNVSLYNETNIGGKVESIYPTPVMGIVGIIDDVTKAVPSGFSAAGESVVMLYAPETQAPESALGSTAFAQVVLGQMWGTPPALSIEGAARLQKVLVSLSQKGLISSSQDVCDGGLAVTLAKAAIARGVGAEIQLKSSMSNEGFQGLLFWEFGTHVVVTCASASCDAVIAVAKEHGYAADVIGTTGGDTLRIAHNGAVKIESDVAQLADAFSNTLLNASFREEVLA